MDQLRTAPPGGTIFVEIGTPVCRVDALHALLRLVRLCPSLVVARVQCNVKSLSLVDVVLVLFADRAMACSGGDDGRKIDWDRNIPELEAFVDELWLGALGSKHARLAQRPQSLADLRAHGILYSEDAMRHAPQKGVIGIDFLIGFRRMGGLRVRRMDKMSFNYYFVSKVLRVNALEAQAEADAGSSTSAAAAAAAAAAAIVESGEPAIEERIQQVSNGCRILHVSVRAAILSMSGHDLHQRLMRWANDPEIALILITLPASPEGATALGRILPVSSAASDSAPSAYKWYEPITPRLAYLHHVLIPMRTQQGSTACHQDTCLPRGRCSSVYTSRDPGCPT